MKCERKFTKSKPGKQGLVKFPRTIIESKNQSWEEGYLYCWLYERPASIWTYVWSGLFVLGVLAICLYPLAPFKIKVGVAYASMGLLIFFFALALLRVLLFGAIWVLSGYQFWILPNLFSEQAVTLEESIFPLWSFEKPDKQKKEYYSRALAVGVAALSVWLLYFYKPDTEALKNQAQSAHEKMLELLQQKNPFSMLAGDDNNTNTNQDYFRNQYQRRP